MPDSRNIFSAARLSPGFFACITEGRRPCRSFRSIERAMGIEPTQPAWKAGALPLSYARVSPFPHAEKHQGARAPRSPQSKTSVNSNSEIVAEWGKQDSNLRRLSHQIYSLAHLAALEFPLVGRTIVSQIRRHARDCSQRSTSTGQAADGDASCRGCNSGFSAPIFGHAQDLTAHPGS